MGASIAEILLEQGRQAAAARQQQGAITSGAWTNFANIIGQIPKQIQEEKQHELATTEQAQRMQLGQVQLDEAKRAQAFQSVVSNAVSTTPHLPDEDGSGAVYDVKTIADKLAQNGFGDRITDVTPHLEQLNDAFRAERQAKIALVQRGAQSLLAAGSDPDLTLHFIDGLEKNGTFPKEQLDQYRQIIQQDPSKIQAILTQFAGPPKIAMGAPGATPINELTGQAAGPTLPDKPGEGDYTINGQRFAQGGKPIGEPVPPQRPPQQNAFEQKQVLLDGKPSMVTFDPHTGKSLDASGADVSARVKPIPSQAAVNVTAGNLTADALDQAAKKYLETGQLPPGYGAAGTIQKTAIMNRAAVLDPTAALARNAATFKADSANLTNLQKTEGTLSAFENTAGKNLDQFLTLAEKIPDTGVPWLNTPIRSLSQGMVGSSNMAAINAARDVALREIARVTNDPKLSGALTDSARAEVASLSPQNATFAQIKAVAKVLKQDMANVHAGLNDQIATIKSGIGANGPAPPAAAPPAGRVNPFLK